eukprot:768524-Hanusia_phi.AAC.7
MTWPPTLSLESIGGFRVVHEGWNQEGDTGVVQGMGWGPRVVKKRGGSGGYKKRARGGGGRNARSMCRAFEIPSRTPPASSCVALPLQSLGTDAVNTFKDSLNCALPVESTNKFALEQLIQEPKSKEKCPLEVKDFDLQDWMQQLEEALTEVHSSEDENDEKDPLFPLVDILEASPVPVEEAEEEFCKAASVPETSFDFDQLEMADSFLKTSIAPFSVTRLQSAVDDDMEFERVTFSRPHHVRAEYNRAVGSFAKE